MGIQTSLSFGCGTMQATELKLAVADSGLQMEMLRDRCEGVEGGSEEEIEKRQLVAFQAREELRLAGRASGN